MGSQRGKPKGEAKGEAKHSYPLVYHATICGTMKKYRKNIKAKGAMPLNGPVPPKWSSTPQMVQCPPTRDAEGSD